MNKTLVITAIVLVAVVMGMSAVAPMMPQAEAEDGSDHPDDCPSGVEKGEESGPPRKIGIPSRCPR